MSLPPIISDALYRRLSLERLASAAPITIPEGVNSIALFDYVGANPETIQYKQDGQAVLTINLTWDGDNLTNIAWSY